uniref:Tubulin epsilon 1 n=1 Tax=Salmo trutta TaxID=8032 RepID=A0A674C4Z1_SALTR
MLFFFQSLVDIVNKIKHMSHSGMVGSVIKKDTAIISGQGGVSGAEKPLISARFEGSLNMDLNEIAMNLVPFPRLHYLAPSVTPLYTLADFNIPSRRSALLLDQMFTDASSKDHCLACALRFRGNMQVLRPTLPFVSWNQEGWKTGLCSMPPVDHSLLALANNTCVKPTFIELRDRITKLYRKKAHLHHYLLQGCFTGAISFLSSLIEDYSQLDATKDRLMPDAARLNIAT